jgi:hypothetical protein
LWNSLLFQICVCSYHDPKRSPENSRKRNR